MNRRKDPIPVLTRKKDFETFWQRTLMKLENIPLDIELEEFDYPSDKVKVYEIACKSLLNETLRGWYLLPHFEEEVKIDIPIVIEFPGYMCPVGEPQQYLHWVMAGYAVLVFDVRGQGGKTLDNAPYETYAGTAPIARGLLDEHDYYQRRLFADAYRNVEVAAELHPNSPIILSGASQGGALVMVAAALAKEKVTLALPDVPSSSHIFARIQNEQGSFREIAEYLRRFPDKIDQVFGVQTYFDTMNFAEWITCPVFASVAGKDNVCPADNYMATFERIQTKKELVVYRFNGHEGGGQKHVLKKMKMVREFLDPSEEDVSDIEE